MRDRDLEPFGPYLGPYRTAMAALEPPPRRVPLLLRASLACSSVPGLIGWILMIIGLTACLFFSRLADLSILTFRGPHARTTAWVTGTARTSIRENRRPVWAVSYEFEANGAHWTGTSYSTGGVLPAIGEFVPVEYDSAHPERSRLEGYRRAPIGPWVLAFGLIALIGLVPVTIGYQRGRFQAGLLQSGRVTRGTLIEKKRTRLRVNRRTVMELTFAFTAEDGTEQRAVARTERPEVLEDDAEEQLLYDPVRPERATLLDHLPGSPRVVDGRLETRRDFGSLAPLALPLVAVAELAVGAALLLATG